MLVRFPVPRLNVIFVVSFLLPTLVMITPIGRATGLRSRLPTLRGWRPFQLDDGSVLASGAGIEPANRWLTASCFTAQPP